ncbi:hypothetical protein GDO86_002437 [Hymenochirus boettgeri]|uniref:Secreted protein n=1 Tax=Hymenochirus boettgeri TaxID=247094 RepID=A0A8T2KJ95_9PIPI|nr:hypothetical protein GDO86_002437 [Hymenochirus boettgeri]
MGFLLDVFLIVARPWGINAICDGFVGRCHARLMCKDVNVLCDYVSSFLMPFKTENTVIWSFAFLCRPNVLSDSLFPLRNHRVITFSFILLPLLSCCYFLLVITDCFLC